MSTENAWWMVAGFAVVLVGGVSKAYSVGFKHGVDVTFKELAEDEQEGDGS